MTDRFNPPPGSKEQIDLAQQTALAIVSIHPPERWQAAIILALTTYRGFLDRDHPDSDEDLRIQSTKNFSDALLHEMNRFSSAGNA